MQWILLRNYKVSFGVKMNDHLDPADATNELLENMRIDGPTRTVEPPMLIMLGVAQTL